MVRLAVYQYGAAHTLCMNNLLFKNCLKRVHHSDLFIALFDLNSLSLQYACQKWSLQQLKEVREC